MEEFPIDGTRTPSSQSNSNSEGSPSVAISQNGSWMDSAAWYLFRKDCLRSALELKHITSIAFAGTIGMALFINSGELIGISGSIGCFIGFTVAGVIIIGVMRSLAEMVSVRPLFNAIIDFPHTFVDEALGFAVGITYWLAECFSMAVLTSAGARIAGNFDPDKPLSTGLRAGIIVSLFVVTLVSNAFGVKLYGNLERLVKWVKIFIILSLCILMILINRGLGGYSTESPTKNITDNALTPYFRPHGFYTANSTLIGQENESSFGIPGSGGRFLAVWISITFAVYAFEGTGIVFITAGEAKNPRRDLPRAARYMYLALISLCIVTSFILGFNINFSDPGLFRPFQNVVKPSFASASPFILVMQNTTLAPVLPKVYLGLFLFSAYTAGNTALYAASRTLFALTRKCEIRVLKTTLGRTTDDNTPLAAIFCCSLFALLGLVGLAEPTFNQPILSMTSFFTGSIACVYGSECIAYLRFRRGLSKLEDLKELSRDGFYYKSKYYRPKGQLVLAWIGLVGCSLIMMFTGWPAIYIMIQRHALVDGEKLKPNSLLAWDVVGAYAGPLLFFSLFFSYKILRGTKFRRFETLRRAYYLPEFDDEVQGSNVATRRDGDKAGLQNRWQRVRSRCIEVWEFIG